MSPVSPVAPVVVGRYAIHKQIAAGGMASVCFGRMRALGGTGRPVAIKRLHTQFAQDADFVAAFLDEARLAMRIQHANVVQTMDVVAEAGELLLVMEYVHGVTLAQLVRLARDQRRPIPKPIAVAICIDLLRGLHAAHEATDERGHALSIVHRDVSPQNVLVGVDGVGRVLDFGIAKAEGRLQVTRNGEVKGKLAYMAPEQVSGAPVDRAADVFAAGVVLWELLAGRGLFRGTSQKEILAQLLTIDILPPSRVDPSSPKVLDDIVLSAVERDVASRTSSAKAVADALGAALDVASHSEVGAWVEEVALATLAARAAIIAEMEQLEYQAPSRTLLETALTQSTQVGTTPSSQAAPASGPVLEATTVGVTADQTVVDSPRARAVTQPPAFRRRFWVAAGVILVAVAGLGLGLQRSTERPEGVKTLGSAAPGVTSSSIVALDTVSIAVPPSAASAAPPIASSHPSPRPSVAPPAWRPKSPSVASATASVTQAPPSKPCKTTLVWNAELKAMVAVRPPECPPP